MGNRFQLNVAQKQKMPRDVKLLYDVIAYTIRNVKVKISAEFSADPCAVHALRARRDYKLTSRGITILSQNWPGRCALSFFSALSLDLPTPNPTTGYESAPLMAHRHRIPRYTIVACDFVGVVERMKKKKKGQSALQP